MTWVTQIEFNYLIRKTDIILTTGVCPECDHSARMLQTFLYDGKRNMRYVANTLNTINYLFSV